jgi:hypothetical protein
MSLHHEADRNNDTDGRLWRPKEEQELNYFNDKLDPPFSMRRKSRCMTDLAAASVEK